MKVFILSRILGLSLDLSKMGKWAVVTGATDGIGKSYATELAKMGMNVMLISRSEEKLRSVMNEIKEKTDVELRYVVFDFSSNREEYSKIDNELENVEIGVLVNNVGVSYRMPNYFPEMSRDEHSNIVNVNSLSMVMMTHIVLPRMVARNKGVILNVSSASALVPSGMLTTYSASKAFADHFSRCLAREYKDSEIIIQSVLPFFVATKMAKMRPNVVVPSPDAYVKSALATVGLESQTHGCFTHKLQGLFLSILGEYISSEGGLKILHINRKKQMAALARKKKT